MSMERRVPTSVDPPNHVPRVASTSVNSQAELREGIKLGAHRGADVGGSQAELMATAELHRPVECRQRPRKIEVRKPMQTEDLELRQSKLQRHATFWEIERLQTLDGPGRIRPGHDRPSLCSGETLALRRKFTGDRGGVLDPHWRARRLLTSNLDEHCLQRPRHAPLLAEQSRGPGGMICGAREATLPKECETAREHRLRPLERELCFEHRHLGHFSCGLGLLVQACLQQHLAPIDLYFRGIFAKSIEL